MDWAQEWEGLAHSHGTGQRWDIGQEERSSGISDSRGRGSRVGAGVKESASGTHQRNDGLGARAGTRRWSTAEPEGKASLQ